MLIWNSIYFVLATIGNITREGFRTVNMLAVKSFPILAIPIFLVTAIGSILLNDQLWTKTMDSVHFVQTAGGGQAKGGFMELYGKMNYFFPISESLLMFATLVPLKLICTMIRILKSCIPTIG